MFDQGFVVYETVVAKRTSYFEGYFRDYALIFLDGVYVSYIDRSETSLGSFKVECQQSTCNLRIIVEAMGHINFDHQMETDYKGILDFTDDLGTIFKWNMYKMPVDANILKWTNFNSSTTTAPVLLKASLNLQ